MINPTAQAFDEALADTIGYIETEYCDGRNDYTAIQISWRTVTSWLSRDHDGSPEDDRTLADALLAAGAPDWVANAEGWNEPCGWGLIGPRIDYRI